MEPGWDTTLGVAEMLAGLYFAAQGDPLVLDEAESTIARSGTRISAEQLDLGLTRDWPAESGLVIGRGSVLREPGALGAGEYRLSWLSVQESAGGMEAEATVNAAQLQSVMKLNLPIRDASPLTDTGGFYLERERALLRTSGWSYLAGYWVPPVAAP